MKGGGRGGVNNNNGPRGGLAFGGKEGGWGEETLEIGVREKDRYGGDSARERIQQIKGRREENFMGKSVWMK